MTADWTRLDNEIAIWTDLDMRFPLWWRDDDAVSDTSQLKRLGQMADTFNLPVHLAVIPQKADPTLVATITHSETFIPVVHGWSHVNHAPLGQKKAEFSGHRPLDTMRVDVEKGLRQLKALFGTKLQPMFVPPWNRIAPDLYPILRIEGFTSLSTYGPRALENAYSGLRQINTHIDPIDWKNTRSLLPEQMIIDRTADLLIRRRLEQADNREPLGLLTHHLIHDTHVWDFCDQLLEHLLTGPADIWYENKETTT